MFSASYILEVEITEGDANRLDEICAAYNKSREVIVGEMIRADYHRCYGDIAKSKQEVPKKGT